MNGLFTRRYISNQLNHLFQLIIKETLENITTTEGVIVLFYTGICYVLSLISFPIRQWSLSLRVSATYFRIYRKEHQIPYFLDYGRI